MEQTSFPPWYLELVQVTGLGYLFYLFLIALGAFWGLRFFRTYTLDFKFLAILMAATLISETLSRFLIIIYGSSFPCYHFLIPAEFVLYGLIYAQIAKSNRSVQRAIVTLGIVASIISLTSSVRVSGFFEFPSINIIFLSIFLIANVLYSFYQMLRSPSEKSLLKQPLFWFNSVNLVFYGSGFFIFGLKQHILEMGLKEPGWTHLFSYYIGLSLYAGYFYSFFLERKNIKSKP
jgi:hypothetical protein